MRKKIEEAWDEMKNKRNRRRRRGGFIDNRNENVRR
jgi:hypothetical protein